MDPEPPDVPTTSDESLAAQAAGALVVDAALRHAGSKANGHHHGPVHTHCENCGTKLDGPYCHRCGQHDFEFHRSFRHVFLEALENFFHFEGKFFRNIVTLMFWPGRLTAEFNAGKRVVQMPPFRLYLFVSVLFFFLFFLGEKTKRPTAAFGDIAGTTMTAADAERQLDAALSNVHIAQDAAAKASLETVRQAVVEARKEAEQKEKGRSGDASGKSDSKRDRIRIEGSDESAFLRWVENTGNRLADAESRRKFGEAFLHSVPRLLLFCLPFFALYTRVLFRKSGQVYLQHLLLALHFHTFVYLWLLFRDGWTFLAQFASPALGSLVFSACTVWAVLYPVLMFRRLFANSWARTVLKTGVLAFVYLITISLGFAITGLIVVATV